MKNIFQSFFAQSPLRFAIFTMFVLSCMNSSAITQVEGVYQISSAQDLWEFADIVNGTNGQTKNLSASAKLTQDIDLGGSTHWVSMGTSGAKYQGFFDGGGHTISKFYQSFSGACQGTGLFGFTSGAKISNFKIAGDVYYTNTTSSSYFLSTVVGNGTGTTIEDVSSSVNMSFTGGSDQTRIIGGIAGRNDGVINRCRYNGTINLDSKNAQKVAGICASSFGVTITNCLFDGTITTKTESTANDKVIIGGILGHDENRKTTIAYCISIGTITLSNSPVSENVGAVWGQNAGTQVGTSNVYYTAENVTKNSNALDEAGGANASGVKATNGLIKLEDAANRNSAYWEGIRNTLKSENWHIETAEGAPAYPLPGKTTDCIHEYTASGWCSKCAARKPLVQDNGTYIIDCLAQFASFRDLVNKSKGAELNAKFTNDMDFNLYPGYLGEPIGYDQANPYHGTFDGQGHSIIAVHIDGRHNYIGQFGYIKDATIKNLKIAGDINIYTNCTHVGSIAGYSTGECHFQDISSTMSINLDAQDDLESQAYHNVQVVGGIVGRIENTSTTIERCRFAGSISGQQSYDRIGGIVGETFNCNLANDLFDGTISITNPSADIIAGGLVGQLSGSTNIINNCLSCGSINQASTKAGAIVGYSDSKNLNIERVLYTQCGSITSAFGSARTGATTSTYDFPWDITSDTKLYDGEAHALLGENNWLQTEFTEGKHPVPGTGGPTHEHSFNTNGFCKAHDSIYQPAEKDLDGYYKIGNAGQLWWITTQLNNGALDKTIRIKLINDIDMEGIRRGSFPGICPLINNTTNQQTTDVWETAFQGTFDGKGHTINHYYRTMASGLRQGMFNAAHNAKIRHFNINGDFVLTKGQTESALIGAVIGSAHGTTSIEDINSSVNIISDNARGLGGIVGAMEDQQNRASVTMNRCRYNGNITLSGNTQNAGIGGICGELRSAIISNSLYDGTITAANGVSFKYIGGIVGKVGTSDNSEMHRILCHGTINLANYTEETNRSGVVIGCVEKTLYMTKCFHTTSNTSNGLPAIGQHTGTKTITNENEGTVGSTVTVDYILGESTDKTSNLADLYSSSFRATLGESNWASVTSGYTYPLKDEAHIHKFVNGFCTSGDGEYEKPNSMGSTYQIDNGGKLYWFAEHFNAGEIEENATVEIVNTNNVNLIDMDGGKYTFPGIGSSSHKFKGTFNGHGNIISNFHRDIVNSENTGLINYAEDATIKDFTLQGSMNFNLASIKSFHGTVVGMALGNNTRIEDITSSVIVDMGNANVRVFGGIAGRASGEINRCNYSGTIDCKGSGRQIGGICANAKSQLKIQNCIFDGTITSYCSEADTMRVSGILASNEKRTGVKIEIRNCLFNGCLDLTHTYTGSNKSTENGLIAGYWDTSTTAVLNNVFTLSKCKDKMKDLPAGNFNTTPTGETTVVDSGSEQFWDEEKGEPNWEAIIDTLNSSSNAQGTQWTYVTVKSEETSDSENPVETVIGITPNANRCSSHQFNQFGWCSQCGERRTLTIDDDGKYLITCLADLASFRDKVNSGTTESGVTYNAKLMCDLDFAQFPGDLGQPIGYSYYNRYLYNFDGQGHSIDNIRVTTNNEYVGLFGFAGDETHDCTIENFTITGTIEAPYSSEDNDDKPLCAGVVGRMERGIIRNVHSQMNISNLNQTRANIGGILGCAETKNGSVTISDCSYIGLTTVNAYGNMGGILGKATANTLVEHCTFAGGMNHTYQGEANMTQFGGVVGYNDSQDFKGIKNCVIAGAMQTDQNRHFVDYGTEGNHKNALCGEDKIITEITTNNTPNNTYTAKYSGNYAMSVYKPLIAGNSIVEATYTSDDDFASGKVCAELNAIGSTNHTWGQIVGYQKKGYKTEGSPAQRVPFPGYANPERNVHKVVKDGSNNYTIDYLYLDDNGDTCPLPSGANSIKAKKIKYNRASSYMTTGYISVCMPFALDERTLPGGSSFASSGGKIKLFDKVVTSVSEDGQQETGTVYFKDEETPIAGKPYFLYIPESLNGQAWNIDIVSTDGINIVSTPSNPVAGILGSFETIQTGAWTSVNRLYKLNATGDLLLKTNENSSCFPYRGYFKMPTLDDNGIAISETASFRLSFDDYEEPEEPEQPEDPSETMIEQLEEEGNETPTYNLYGQRAGAHVRGMVISNGKLQIKR